MIKQLRIFSTTDRQSKGLDLIFDDIDDKLLADRFDDVDAQLVEFLQLDDFDWMPASWPIGVLTITLAAKEHLKERSAFYTRTENWLIENRGVDQTKRLLSGLQ